MKFVWVSRDAQGVINGVFARRQKGIAEERLLADDPEVLAFLNPPAPDRGDVTDRIAVDDPFHKGLLGTLAERLPGNPTVDELLADIKRLGR